ncbi:MAG: Stk1 family PASTA domain-containing Ser/Thr kinase [Acidimicrobiia bacterium]
MAAPVAVFANRYQLQREIARGGMAEVYLARDDLLDRPVAVKVLSAEYARDPSFVERFRREAQSAAGLNHPDIVAIYDWGQEQGTYFIVMEYVAGHTLRDVLKTEGVLSPERSAGLAAEIAAALDYAHRAGVVHRDIKPGNVLVDSDGSAKVTDFGIARADTGEALTQTGSVMGTATYFSPEQAQGLAVDGRSDVYSLGVVLYEMVCGVTPFQGENPVSVAYQHVRETPPPPSEHRLDIPPDLEAIIMACLSKEPDQRYQSAHDLREDLLRFLRGRPPLAAPLALAAAAAGAGAATTVANPAVAEALPAADEEKDWKKSRRWWVFTVLLLLLGGGIWLIWSLSSSGGEATPLVEVPDVTDMTEEEAVAALSAAGFEVEVEREIAFLEKGLVAKQNPPGGEEARDGSVVTITVSEGLGEVEIPPLAGRTAEDARDVLEDLNLTVEEQEEETTDVEPGVVIRTEPASGTLVERGSKVVMIVSAGPGSVEVPQVDGLSVNAAVEALTAAGFTVQQVPEPSDTVPADQVIRTDPAGGSQAPQGSTVQLFVSSGRPSGAVPGVVGKDQSAAEAELSAAGFVPRVVIVESSPGNDGKVINQNPTGGTNAPTGTEVVIQVGQAPTTSSTTTTASP